MNLISKIRFFILLSLLPTLLSLSAVALNLDESQCDAYSAVSEQLNCNDDNYLNAFGKKYCLKFIRKNDHFSKRGQVILDRIRSCLINKITASLQLTCENSKKTAEQHHFDCYLSEGFCDITFVDEIKIGIYVRNELFDNDLYQISQRIYETCYMNKYGRSPYTTILD